MSKRYYSINHEGAFEEHETLAEARKAAEEWLQIAADSEEWPEGVDRIEYGQLMPFVRAVEYDRRDDPDGNFDYLCSYKLEGV